MARPPGQQLHLPSTTRRVFINIGSNVDPLLPPESDRSVVSIAFEPIVSSQIAARAGLFVVPSAVSNFSGIGLMGVYNERGLSSSLSKPAWEFSPQTSPPRLVPVLSMRAVLGSIPAHIDIWFLKTDMQGHDFVALSSAADLLRTRVHYIMSEVAVNNVRAYNGTSNDLCRQHLPFMRANGFTALGMCKPCQAAFPARLREANSQRRRHQSRSSSIDTFCHLQRRNRERLGLAERDVWWRRDDTTLPPPPSDEWWMGAERVASGYRGRRQRT